MKSVPSWREMLFRFTCCFSRDSLARLLSLWPGPDPSKCGCAQGLSLNFLSRLPAVILGVTSTQPGECDCHSDTNDSETCFPSPGLLTDVRLSMRRRHLNTPLSPNTPKSALLISALLLHPLTRAWQSLPWSSVNGSPSALLLRPQAWGPSRNPLSVFTPVQSVCAPRSVYGRSASTVCTAGASCSATVSSTDLSENLLPPFHPCVPQPCVRRAGDLFKT